MHAQRPPPPPPPPTVSARQPPNPPAQQPVMRQNPFEAPNARPFPHPQGGIPPPPLPSQPSTFSDRGQATGPQRTDAAPFRPPRGPQLIAPYTQDASPSSPSSQMPHPPMANGYHSRNSSHGGSGYSGGQESRRGPPPPEMSDMIPRAYTHDPSFAAHPKHPLNHLVQGASGPPPPPPPSSYSGSQMSSQQENLRRRSLGGSPPGPYGAHEPPPPPPPLPPHQAQQYQPRHMRPPSPQQQHQSNHPLGPPLSQRPQYNTSTPPSYPAQPAGRDLPSLTALHRPGSSMSISSMLGTDSMPSHENPPPPQHFQPSPAGPAPHPQQMQQTATSHPPGGFARNEYPNYRRPQTPDNYPQNMVHGARPSRANSAGSPPSYQFASGRGSPTPFSHSPSHIYHRGPPQSPQNMAPHPSRDGPPNSRVENPPIVSRPSSQPPPSGDSYKEREMGNRASVTNFGRPSSFNERQAYPDAMHDRMREGEFPSDRRVREMQREVDRDRPNGSSGPSSSPTHQQTTPFGTRERDRDAGNQRTWDISPEHGSHTGRPLYPHTSASLAANNMYSASSPNYPPYSHNTPGGDAQMATRDGPRQLGQFQNFEGSTQPIRGSISSPFDGLRGPRPYNSSQQPMPASGNQLFATGSGTPDHLQQRRVNNESPQPNARGLLGIYNEINRKGRLSPLPQAVQGAQGQISGPAGEPGIKSEFGRMFSGIGSGVGSGMSTSSPVGNGPPLGPNMSRREDGVDSPVFEGCIDGGEKFPRTSSRGGRRSKIMADDARNDSESGDGRLSPSGVVSRGAKRARHRHHHHAHHHHHHNRPEDDVASPQPLPLPYPGLNNLKRTSTPLQNQLVSGGHHHHHHHHHAHRSTPPTITPAPIPFRKLVKTINSQDVLDQVSHLPRHHLGSAVYSQKISASVNRHSKNGFVYTPIPLPRLEGKENCTFTMRVPRNFLTPAMREQVVLRRALWGCDIYTDDSDVLAACIHSGWIRGEWPDNIDISLLDLATKDSVHPKNKPMQSSPLKGSSPFQMVMTSPPSAGPVVPPANMDLHVTLLVLPTLQKYTSTISHGIRSRSWAGNHDGMSYKILKLSWITEGTTPVEGRSGEDRRKRMRSMMTWKGGMGGSGVSISLNSKPKGGDPKCGNPKSDEPMSGDPKINGLKIKDPENGDLENEGPKNGDLENGDPMDEDPKTGDPMDEDPKDKDLKSCDPKSDYLKNKDPKNGDFENGDPMNEDSKIEDSKSEDPKNEDPKDDDLENADAELQPLAAI